MGQQAETGSASDAVWGFMRKYGMSQLICDPAPVAQWYAQKGLNDKRIELTPGFLRNQSSSSLKTRRCAVGAMRRDCVKCVSYCEDPRTHWDLLTGQATGIPTAIEMLVVRKNDFCGLC